MLIHSTIMLAPKKSETVPNILGLTGEMTSRWMGRKYLFESVYKRLGNNFISKSHVPVAYVYTHNRKVNTTDLFCFIMPLG